MATKTTKIPKDIDRKLSPKARKFVLELIDEIKDLRREKAELRKRIEVLEAQLKELTQELTPQNSSVSPSTVHPHARTKSEGLDSARGGKLKKQGAQPGHARHTRPLVSVNACEQVEDLRPDRCRKCDHKLFGNDPEPLRHQLIDIPPIQPTIIEYRRHRLTCRCGESTCAPLPAGVPSGQCGPRLAASYGLLMGHSRQRNRRTANFLQDILNVPCST